jgi:sugar lactone lactonase YvrE
MHRPATTAALRRTLTLGPALLLGLLLLPAACRRGEPPQRTVLPDPTLHEPESALWDSAGGVWLVSNVNGSPLARDDNGFISRLDALGRPLLWLWIDGADPEVALDAPKGMALRGDTLFVADIAVVRLFSRSTGRPLGEWVVPGATFLNDLAVGPDGTLYATDTGLRLGANGAERSGSDAVWRFNARGAAEAVARDTALGEPNGVLAELGGLTVVTLGSGAVYRLDARGRRTDLPKPPHGALDGVVRANDGSLLVSSWEGKAVYRLKGEGPWTTEVDSVESPADIGWNRQQGRLAIPLMGQNRLLVREVR